MILSVEEYDRLKRRDREVLSVDELSDADLDAIGRATVPPGHEHLDGELTDQ